MRIVVAELSAGCFFGKLQGGWLSRDFRRMSERVQHRFRDKGTQWWVQKIHHSLSGGKNS